jgi:hypothetical protein
VAEGGTEAIKSLISQPADSSQRMTGADPLLDRDVREQGTTTLLMASHQGLCGCSILAGTAEFFCKLLTASL